MVAGTGRALPQEVRMAPTGQVWPPNETGSCPHVVSQIPPVSQAKLRKWLQEGQFLTTNLNLLNYESFRCEQRRFQRYDS
jgi:hypothetical protein